MANRFWSPNQQFSDSTGLPYAGGSVAFFASGTSTPLNTYSDSALSVANPNPIVLDSAGRAGSVFLQNLPYKVVLSDANSNQIWTEDPVWSSDYSALAQVQPFSGNPNGLLAGTAGTQGALPGSSMAWDYINNILYVCTTTGTSTTAVWTAVNTPVTSSFVPTPGGYLTTTGDANNPILNGDAVGNSTIFYTPYANASVPIFNGTSFASLSFTQPSLGLVASHAASTIYDVFMFNNSGTVTLVTGPAWATSTAGAGSRGTGGGTTQIQRLNGIWVNAVQITGRNASTTFTIAANLATYLGSIFIDTTPGQCSCYRSYGQSRKWGIWNAYNRVPAYLKAGDSTASWGVTQATLRALNNNTANSLTVFQGLQEEAMFITSYYNGSVNGLGVGNTLNINAGIGFNSTSAISGTLGQFSSNINTGAGSTSVTTTVRGAYETFPTIGINVITHLESSNASITTTANGNEGNNAIIALWRA